MDGVAAAIRTATEPNGVVRWGDSFPALPVPDEAWPEAAILLLLFPRGPRVHVLLTLRASTLRLHAGECALPGGRRDRSDADVVETALRETQEEVGVAVPRECVLARLEPLGSRHGLRVHPVLAAVAFDPVAAARPNAAEVSAVFDAPLDLFLTPQPDCHRTVDLALDRHTRFRAHFFRSGGHTVWGLTALALILAARAALGRRASFRVGHPAAIPTRPRPRL